MGYVFAAVVPKDSSKVDLWGSCRFDEDGNPKSSVLTQGSNTFAKNTLFPLITEAYNVNWEEVEYVDLVMDPEHTVKSANNIYYIPKKVVSGPRKGQDDVVRRENINVMPLILMPSPDELVVNEATTVTEPQTEVEDVITQDTVNEFLQPGDEVGKVEAVAPSDDKLEEGKGWSETFGHIN